MTLDLLVLLLLICVLTVVAALTARRAWQRLTRPALVLGIGWLVVGWAYDAPTWSGVITVGLLLLAVLGTVADRRAGARPPAPAPGPPPPAPTQDAGPAPAASPAPATPHARKTLGTLADLAGVLSLVVAVISLILAR